MDTSMMFLKIRDWHAFLSWMESPDVLNCHLKAYREACAKAQHSQLYHMKRWLLENQDAKEAVDVKTECKHMDMNAHMIARVTMNGFVQVHFMWNKDKKRRHGSKTTTPVVGTSTSLNLSISPSWVITSTL